MRRILLVALLAIICMANGCATSGRNPTNINRTVRGKALAPDGSPAKWVSLTFYPTSQGGTTANASVDGDGKFVPKTMNNEDGILPGSYKVVVNAIPNKAGTKVAAKCQDELTTEVVATVGSSDASFTVQLK